MDKHPEKRFPYRGEVDVINAPGNSGHNCRQKNKNRPGSQTDNLGAAIAAYPYLIAKEPIGTRGGAQSFSYRRRRVDIRRLQTFFWGKPTVFGTMESLGSNWTNEENSGDPYREDEDEGDQLFTEDHRKSYGAPWAVHNVVKYDEIIDIDALRTHIDSGTDRREDAARSLLRETIEYGRAAESLGENVFLCRRSISRRSWVESRWDDT